MVNPDLGVTVVDLKDDGGKVELWFPPGAIHKLAEALGEGDITLTNTPSLAQKIGPGNLHLYLWAGTLHKERDQDIGTYVERVNWCKVPLLDLSTAVSDAFMLSIFGEKRMEELEAAKDEDPLEANLGTGKKPNGSLSADSA